MENQSIDVNLNRYQIIPRTLVFIKSNEKYLLIHKKNYKSFGYKKINGVGGHLEKGEEPFESASREILEETGLRISNLELIAILFIDLTSSPGIQVFVFKGDYFSGEITNSVEGDLKWMSFSEIKKSKNVVFDVPELIEICESHINGCKPVILKYLYNDLNELRIVKK